MFNNPFGSFHDTVAAAKEERERLDGLLTVSTPRERFLVVGIASLLVVLAGWLYVGSVPRSVAVDGVLVELRDGPGDGFPTVRAIIWLRGAAAPKIDEGMPAAIDLTMAEGKPETLEGRVAAISAVNLSRGVADFATAAGGSVFRLDIALDEGLEPGSLPDRKARIFIELGRQAPIALFGTRRP
ncbi:MAG: hypothetical protein OXC01_12620 [Immundisolibacterales bacterium]|nr:hypothetical protein [Immundisolibacterales bacterium]